MNTSIMIALGGSALSPKDKTGTIKQQFETTRQSLDGVMEFINLGSVSYTHLTLPTNREV